MNPLAAEGVDDGMRGPRRTIAIACVLAAIVLVVLDAAVANVALPAIARSLAVEPAVSVRVVTAYQMALVMALLPCAALGESLGYRRVYTAGVALFTGASALCALAPSLPLLVAARFVQGLGGAAIMSLGVALLRLVVPRRQLGAAIGWNALAVALAAAAGPTVGAMILSAASWPWLFAVNLPIGALVMLATRALPHAPGSARPLDLVSVALNASAFAALIVGAELLSERPALAATLLAVAAIAMAALVRRELPREAPLIPLDLLRDASFRTSVVASVCCFIGQGAAMVSLPFYLQRTLGQDALHVGLLITPWPLTVAIVAPIAGRLVERVSGAWLCAVGGGLLALGLAGAASYPLAGRPLALIPFMVLCGAGFGLFQVPNNRNMFLSAPHSRSGAAGGMQGTARLTGQTIGAVLMTLLFTLTSIDVAARVGLGVAAALASTAGLVSTLRR
ncbi:MAG: MFS transporter [Deltaproteobacteria bacterium]|nr:MFS transporter [Myxococcales bacterium]MDP3215571.1 MFS transporter [Deltaproteobacteria bacterium]